MKQEAREFLVYSTGESVVPNQRDLVPQWTRGHLAIFGDMFY